VRRPPDWWDLSLSWDAQRPQVASHVRWRGKSVKPGLGVYRWVYIGKLALTLETLRRG
jgi:hypothetical protein